MADLKKKPEELDPTQFLVSDQEMSDARDEKRSLAQLGAVAGNLSNRQSFGNYFLGKMAPQQTGASDLAKTFSHDVDERLGDKKRLLENYRTAKALQKEENERSLLARQRDPLSEESQTSYRANSALSPRLKKAFAGLSYEQQQVALKNPALLQSLQMDRELAVEGVKSRAKNDAVTNLTPDQKLAKLSGEERKRLDNVLMGLRSVDRMEKALAAKQNTVSLVGDNDFTMGEREWIEALGRMQSGGVISKDEGKSFGKFVPGYFDDDPIKKTKLATAKNEMVSRLKNMGFEPSHFAEQTAVQLTPVEPRGGLIKEAVAGQPSFDERDIQAFEEAKRRITANPNDQTAKQTLGYLRSRGLE